MPGQPHWTHAFRLQTSLKATGSNATKKEMADTAMTKRAAVEPEEARAWNEDALKSPKVDVGKETT